MGTHINHTNTKETLRLILTTVKPPIFHLSPLGVNPLCGSTLVKLYSEHGIGPIWSQEGVATGILQAANFHFFLSLKTSAHISNSGTEMDSMESLQRKLLLRRLVILNPHKQFIVRYFYI